MNRSKETTLDMYFIPKKLKSELERISHYPLTIVEASSGFGKTTAVREYLKEYQTQNTQQLWYTCLGEPSRKVWEGICQLFSCINQEISAKLLNIGMPSEETQDVLADIVMILRELRCEKETYLVIDNYQLFETDISRELINTFSMHGNANLHIIFITQYLENSQQNTVHNANIYIITPTCFFFDKESIAGVFKMAGIRLTNAELDRIQASTEGWVSAIRLHMINFQETGVFQYTLGIEQLVETAIWNRLTADEKNFLLSVSILDGFTAPQAAILINEKTLPEKIIRLLRNNSFIRYLPDKSTYIIHSILQDYLRNQFYNQQSADFQRQILWRAGQSFVAKQEYYPAAQFFYKVGDFDALLSMPFKGEYLNHQKERYFVEFVVTLVDECPPPIMCKYPFAMLAFAFQLFMDRQLESFGKICNLINQVIENSEDFSEDEIRRIKGEFALVTSFVNYNDIEKMSAGHKRAWELLGGPTTFFHPTTPWTFGSASVVYMFWSKTGELEKELKCMEQCIPYYNKLTRGHGTSADSVMLAEALLLRGAVDEAEVMCHKAMYAGRSYKQTSLCLCAELIFARIAILRGDVEGYNASLSSIRQYTGEKPERYVVRIVDLCMANISLTLGSIEGVAKWISDIESMKKNLYVPAIPYGQMLYGKQLLIEKRYSELYGISQLAMGMAKGMHYVLSQVYYLIYLAVAKYNTGNEIEAHEYLKSALELALPDKVYMPFAEQGVAIAPLLEKIKLSVDDSQGVNNILELCQRQTKGVNAINKALTAQKSSLTPRERDVAALARERLSAKEIAEKLFLSQATVKTILKNVYTKLDIHRKADLEKIKF